LVHFYSIVSFVALVPLAGQRPQQQGSTQAVAARDTQAIVTPTLEETVRWLEGDMPPLSKQSLVEKRDRWTYLNKHEISGVRVTSCVLTFTSTIRSQPYLDNDKKEPFVASASYEVALRDVDPNGVTVKEVPTLNGSRFEVVGYEVRVAAAPARGKVFRLSATSGPSLTAFVDIPSYDRESGQRISRAIQHAAALCGAKGSTF
jgi:hypothetical protein